MQWIKVNYLTYENESYSGMNSSDRWMMIFHDEINAKNDDDAKVFYSTALDLIFETISRE
jgi:hypothetical protein